MDSTSFGLNHLDFTIQEDELPRTLRVTVRNNSPTTTVTILKWDTPLEKLAIHNGMIAIREKESPIQLVSPGVLVNRMLPPPREALLELQPREEFTSELLLEAPWIPNDGKTCEISAAGTFRAVWSKSSQDISDDDLASFGGDLFLSGPFESNTIEMRL